MIGWQFANRRVRLSWKSAGVFVLALAWTLSPSRPAQGQTGQVSSQPGKLFLSTDDLTAPDGPALEGGGVQQAGCSSCGVAPLSSCASCGGGGASSCRPGAKLGLCCDCPSDSVVGRAFFGVYNCLCCPDPCYEPQWLPIADSAFFVDAARPKTQTRLRVDAAWDLKNPDRAEYFWAHAITSPAALGPGGPCKRVGAPKNSCFARSVDYQSLSLYTEAASGGFSAFVDVPYEHLDPHSVGSLPAPTTADPAHVQTFPLCCSTSGFADMNIGTKAMLLDCELMQVTFQFKTFLPVGDFTKGLGTGHVSLEPSLLMNVKLNDTNYIQAQLSYWIPLGGDPLYQANIFHTHTSFNHLLWSPCPGLRLIGTIEMNEWSVIGGAYTGTDFLIVDPNGLTKTPPVIKFAPAAISGNATIFSAGPGLRLFICDRFDVGVGSAFSFTGPRWAEDVVRSELRVRF